MNALSRKLSSRTMSGPDPHAHRTLADLGRGDRAIIAGVRTDIAPDVARRLFDLGFTPGSEVALLRRSPLA
ncbi:MAG: FeoA family protein, partial [Propionibacteriaceae bacterium]|nr:FeoA family protein [Propionibacteriaceae bacterium]